MRLSRTGSAPSHHRVAGILVLVPGRRGELAEAGRPARPGHAAVPGKARRRTRRQRAEAARELRAVGGVERVERVEAFVLGEEALDELEFLLLLPQEDVHQELLLPFELLHDGFGNVGDPPGNDEAEEHHQILEGRGERTM